MKFRTACVLLAGIVLSGNPLAGAAEEDLVSAQERRHRRVREAAERVTVALYVDRKSSSNDGASPRSNRIPGRLELPSVFSRRPDEKFPVSAMVWAEDGYLFTTAFNINLGEVDSIQAVFPDGTRRKAEVVGFHELYDLALLKVELDVEGDSLEVLERADLSALVPGVPLMAAGRSPNGRTLTLHPGIFSAPGREGGKAIQTDCRINYGSVGGPLLDGSGRLVGLTVKVRTQESASLGQNSGVSMALTLDAIDELLPKLKEGLRVVQSRSAFLGIQGEDWVDGDGVEILQVIPGTAAEGAGLQPGDVIVLFGGTPVDTMIDLRDRIVARKVGDEVKMEVLRNGRKMELVVTLGKRS